jgi:hypothetical protein
MKATLSYFAAATMMAAMLLVLAPGFAHAEGIPPQCSNVIKKCGCTIGAPGNYQLANDLDASQGLTLLSGCIDIEGKHINLAVNYNIFGFGGISNCGPQQPARSQKFTPFSPPYNTGIGIHVLPTAANVVIDANESTICGWNYGVESEALNVNLFGIVAVSNNVGVLLNNATDNSCLYCSTSFGGTGLQIAGGSDNSVGGSQAVYNNQYGFWIDGSKHNMINSNISAVNGLAGFYLGCSATADVKPLIPCTIVTTTGNSILSNESIQNNKYGIATERQSFYNNYDNNGAAGNLTKDIIDGNANCVYNNYQDDEYVTKSPKCIQ